MAAPRRSSRIVEGSCRSCRVLRVKCDLLPTCTRCARALQPCDYGPPARFRWVGGVALRGPKAPICNISKPSRPDPTASITAIVHHPKPPALDPDSMASYFANAVLPRFQLVEDSLPVDFAFISQHEPLKQAIVAVSRAHIDVSSCGTSKDALVVRRRARITAIQSLRTQLEAGVTSDRSAQQLFTVNVLLCMLDGMLEPAEEEPNASLWHLRGGFALLQQHPCLVTGLIAEDGMSAHLLSIFATMDLVHALLSGDKPYIDPIAWHMFAGTHTWWGRLQQGDRFLDLMKVLSELASLGSLVASTLPGDTGQKLAERCLPLFETILDARWEENGGSQCIQPHLQHWRSFCHLFEVAARIYILRALRIRAADDPAVQQAVQEGIAILVDHKLPGMLRHCTVLPVLVLGAHALTESHRDAITKTLTPTISYLSFGNLAVMKDLLQDVWRKSDWRVNWWETFDYVSHRVFLF